MATKKYLITSTDAARIVGTCTVMDTQFSLETAKYIAKSRLNFNFALHDFDSQSDKIKKYADSLGDIAKTYRNNSMKMKTDRGK